jgi:hypothetical protein
MKAILITAALLITVGPALSQERLSRQEALKYAFVLSADLKRLQGTPIPTDPDVKRPVGVRDEDYAGMVLPETKLSQDALAKADKEVVPVGQLWLHRLAPLGGSAVVPETKLLRVTVNHEGNDATLVLCALGVRQSAEGKLELLVYGKEKEPVLRAALKPASIAQDNPLELAAERRDDGGLLTLRILGKYEASFMVTDPERY